VADAPPIRESGKAEEVDSKTEEVVHRGEAEEEVTEMTNLNATEMRQYKLSQTGIYWRRLTLLA
jgi:hypothetical protein